MLNMFSRQETAAPQKNAPQGAAKGAPLRLLREQPAAPANTNPAPAANRKAALERRAPNLGQYLYHLQHDLRSYVRAETVNAVIGATPGEIQRVARIVAKLKGRYLATLMDLGNANKGPVGESEVRELRRAREMYEEVELGLTRLREAIEAGDLELDGVKGD
ncbi:MAG TPA: hypothetical protein VFE34_13075 [Dongiaceae bacterium]|jgi:hypothetical protein|nr:hypothetical protein [Dongiaceae bacterium]